MNRKRAKILRGQAEAATIGAPHVSYRRSRHGGTISLDSGCTKAVYRRLKRAERRV